MKKFIKNININIQIYYPEILTRIKETFFKLLLKYKIFHYFPRDLKRRFMEKIKNKKIKQKNLFILESNDVSSVIDEFGIHSDIIDTLENIIINQNFYKYLNIGLFGKWGIGKSFIIKKLEEKFKDDTKILLLNIDVWKFEDDSLLRSILINILKLIKSKISSFQMENIKDVLYCQTKEKKIIKSKILSVIILPILILILSFIIFTNLIIPGESTSFINVILAIIGIILSLMSTFYTQEKNYLRAFSNEKFEELFKEIIKTVLYEYNFKKLFIIFDNIDRCEPELTYQTLATIKTFMDIPNCSYIIPCDDRALRNYINNKYKSDDKCKYDQDFLDKFFNIQLSVPKLDKFDRNKYLEKKLISLLSSNFPSDKVKRISQILYYSYEGLTPRQINRFVNDYLIYYYLARNIEAKMNIKLTDDILFFTLMMVIKQKWKYFENYLDENPTFLSDYSNGNKELDFLDKDLKHFINNSKEEHVNTQIDNLEIFLENIKGFINPNKPVRQYIYLINTSNELVLYNQIDNRVLEIDLNTKNKYLIEKRMKKLYKEQQFIILENNLEFLIFLIIIDFENINYHINFINNLFFEYLKPIISKYQKLMESNDSKNDIIKVTNQFFKSIINKNEDFHKNFISLLKYLQDEDIRYIKRPLLTYVLSPNIDEDKRITFFKNILNNKDNIFNNEDYIHLVNEKLDLDNDFSYRILMELLKIKGSDYLNEKGKNIISEKFVNDHVNFDIITEYIALANKNEFPIKGKRKIFNKFIAILDKNTFDYIKKNKDESIDELNQSLKIFNILNYNDIKEYFKDFLDKFDKIYHFLISSPIDEYCLALKYIMQSIILFNSSMKNENYYINVKTFLDKVLNSRNEQYQDYRNCYDKYLKKLNTNDKELFLKNYNLLFKDINLFN